MMIVGALDASVRKRYRLGEVGRAVPRELQPDVALESIASGGRQGAFGA